MLEQVIPEAKKRGMRTICWYEDVFRRGLPNIEKLQEVELSGKKAASLCFNNPDYLSWLQDMAEDWSRSYDIDGIMWGSERQGALSNVLGASHADPQPSTATCFCEFCYAKARRQGINPERARQGFLELEKFVLASRKGVHPVDGSYVEFWRLMLRYPEVLAWESLWTSSLREAEKAIYDRVKAVNSKLGVGWHIWHNNSFNPIYRAEQDLAEMAPYSDFLKIVMYHNCAGERMADYINSVGTSYFADIPKLDLPEELLRLAEHIIETKTGDFDPAWLEDQYRTALVSMLREKKRAELPTKHASMPGNPRAAYSSYQINCCSSVSPLPPYSVGQAMPAQPPSA